jgi:hypothetical protein
VTIQNHGPNTVTFATGSAGDEAELLTTSHRPVSAIYFTDAIGMQQVSLAPGQSTDVTVRFRASSCADTGDEPEPALPPGHYLLRADLPWTASGGRSGDFVTAELGIDVT